MEYPEVKFAGKVLIAQTLFPNDFQVLEEEEKVLIDDHELDLEYADFGAVMAWLHANDPAVLSETFKNGNTDSWVVTRRKLIDAFMTHLYYSVQYSIQG